MSNENRQEDTVLGAALGRAIETQSVRQTHFAESRLAARLEGRERRSPFFPMLAAAAAVVLGLALGSALLAQRGPGGVATQPTPAPDPSASEAVTPPIEVDPNRDRVWVYFARDQLPPVGAYIGALLGDFISVSAERRTLLRLEALRDFVEDNERPAGTINPVAQLNEPAPIGVLIEGDLATVEFSPNTFETVRGAAMTQAVLRQLVYTISEEPGIRRVLLKERGKNELTIDQLVIDEPLTREDVLPYEGVPGDERISLEDDPRAADATTRIDQSIAGLARFVIELRARETPVEGFWSPRLTTDILANDGSDPTLPGKWLLQIWLEGAEDSGTADRVLDSSPLRAVRLAPFPPGEGGAPTPKGVIYNLALDDARPWRISLEPAAERGTMRLIVDIGGHPQAISDKIAVYGPKPGDEVGRTFTLTGSARVFEATVTWRLKNVSGEEVAGSFVNASIGTSPVWGTFTTEVKVPDGVSGDLFLEVFAPSPADGTDLGKVVIPIRVR